MLAISAITREEAWLKLVSTMLNNNTKYQHNVILEIEQPYRNNDTSKSVQQQIDVLLKGKCKQTTHTVSETIFPSQLYITEGIEGVFETYPNKIYPLIKKANPQGTYALRLVRGTDENGGVINPLEIKLARLKAERLNQAPKKAEYEISLDEIDTIPIFRNKTDINKYMSFPCMSHISFKLCAQTSQLHLTAIYRYQYLVEKALGNLLGLSRLQAAMAREVGIKPGKLVCHATLAQLDYESIGGKQALRTLIEKYPNSADDIPILYTDAS